MQKVLKNKKLVFVLGAGASKDFGYPVGSELRDRILNSPQKFIKNYWGTRAVSQLQETFRKSGIDSIDSFLEHSKSFPDAPNMMDIGKYLIARIILQGENEKRLLQINNNWYRYLYNVIRDEREALTDGRIKFITFNYDLSLEHFFYTVLLNSRFGPSPTSENRRIVADDVGKMKIIHLYGKLGSLDWESPEDRMWGRRSYGRLRNIQGGDGKNAFIQKCAEGIRLVRHNDGDAPSDGFRCAQGYMGQADYLCFLGFGFDKKMLAG